MATHSSVLAWEILWIEEPGVARVGDDLGTKQQTTLYNQHLLYCSWASLVAELVKNPPAVWENWVQSLGWEDPLEKGGGNYLSIQKFGQYFSSALLALC